MSNKKERLHKKQESRRTKLEEKVKMGLIQDVEYKEKKKKPSLPNCVSEYSTAEEELADRQETAEKAMKVYRKLLPNLLRKLSDIKDHRNPNKVKHKITTLMAYGILMFVFHMGSRRETNKVISKKIFFENLNTMFPELESMPHADTLARLLEEIEVSEIQECMIALLKDLIRRKKFRNNLINGKFLVAIDGTQKLYRDYKWDDKCLKRDVGKEEINEQFYVYVLESVLVLNNGITLPLMSEFEKNENYVEGVNKQDCERKAFTRLAAKIKVIFKSSRLAVVLDGLYACGPVIDICNKNRWDYMIVLKEDCLKEVFHEAEGLMQIDPENSKKVIWGDRIQYFNWANDIEYEYGLKPVKKIILNVVRCEEIWIENHTRSTKKTEEKHTVYVWLSSVPLTPKNVFERCNKMGRYRWKIENNILTEKHQGYLYEHCYSYTWNAMEGYHYLMKIGRFLNVLAVNSEILIEKVKLLGIRGFIKEIKQICGAYLLDKIRMSNCAKKSFNWVLIYD